MKYYIVNLKTNKTYVCNELDDMVGWFAQYNHKSWNGKSMENSAFDNLAMNPNDRRYESQFIDGHYKKMCLQREIMVLDEDNRIIDPRQYAKQILSIVQWWDRSYSERARHRYLSQYKHGGAYPIYRQDPIPHTGNRHCHRGAYHRNPALINEKRQSQEHKEYVRRGRGLQLPEYRWYDDCPSRYNNRSWKNKKIRKQYMKRLGR